MNIFTEAAKLEEQNCPFAMAQIVDSRGSTPRHSAQMLVRADGSIVGTIGGGMVERKVMKSRFRHCRNVSRDYSMDVWLVTVRMLSGQIVEVQCQYLSASMVCVHVWC